MKEIPLTRGKIALVSDEDYEHLNQFSWYCGTTGYAYRTIKTDNGKKNISMHREIMGFPELEVDHINHNRIDNRRENLRLATARQNRANSPRKNALGYRGVQYAAHAKRYRAHIHIDGKQKHIGYFDTPEEAHEAYRKLALKHYGEFAYEDKS